MDMENIAYLLGALGDDGVYHLKDHDRQCEYRVVWTQRSSEYLEKTVIPRVRSLLSSMNVSSKIQVIKGQSRFEVRVSIKRLYEVLSHLKRPENILKLHRSAKNRIHKGFI